MEEMIRTMQRINDRIEERIRQMEQEIADTEVILAVATVRVEDTSETM